jgi:hypothetical protein
MLQNHTASDYLQRLAADHGAAIQKGKLTVFFVVACVFDQAQNEAGSRP